MNFLKKKLKPLTAGLTSTNSQHQANQNPKDLEDDLYDEYVVEAPPHPSELIALGVDPSEIDVNDPDKLRELYKRAKDEGKDKKVNSVLLAKQRQKEEIEEKKKTREEWKFFDSLTSRVEQVVKESQKNLNHWKEASAIDKLTEPDYELRLTPDQVPKFSAPKIPEKNQDIEKNLESLVEAKRREEQEKFLKLAAEKSGNKSPVKEELDEFGCPIVRLKADPINESQKQVVEELLEDFGIDLRTAEQKKQLELQKRQQAEASQASKKKLEDLNIKVAARPRPRPGGKNQEEELEAEKEVDPFDTSFLKTSQINLISDLDQVEAEEENKEEIIDPFDTSYIKI